jgi:lipopolysaccharide transport system permease protein
MRPLAIVPLLAIFYHKNLLKGFVSKNIKGRYAGSFVGILWTLLTPLSRIVSYFFVFSMVLRVTVTVDETGTDRFVIFFLCGFFPWTTFAESLTKSVNLLISESRIITKVVFPVELLPVSSVLSTFLINIAGIVIFMIYLAFAGYFNPYWGLVPGLLLLLFLFALGLALFLSAMCVFIRDLGEVLGIVIMLWFFGTPVIYPASRVPESMEFILTLNPMAMFVDTFRDCLLMGRINWIHLAIIAGFCLVSYSLGAWFFMRSKPAFGDVL